MTRRSLLRLCLALAATLACAATFRGSPRPEAPSDLEACVSWIGPRQRARLGRLYLRLHPQERASIEELRKAIQQCEPKQRTRALASLRSEIAADFAGRRTVVADRWILSRSEARLFAALADVRGGAC